MKFWVAWRYGDGWSDGGSGLRKFEKQNDAATFVEQLKADHPDVVITVLLGEEIDVLLGDKP